MENNQNVRYNIDEGWFIDKNNQKRSISYEILPNLIADSRKAKFLTYGQSEPFFVDYNTMEKAVAIGSKYALEAQNMGLGSYSFNDDNYIYYLDILDTRNNSFGITDVVLIKAVSEEVANETYINENSSNFMENTEYEQTNSNRNNQSIRYE